MPIKTQIWEDVPTNVGTYTRRLKVVGGWLIMDLCDTMQYHPDRGNVENGYTSSICFMPDPNHEWLKEESL
jgi:hypothetical protein